MNYLFLSSLLINTYELDEEAVSRLLIDHISNNTSKCVHDKMIKEISEYFKGKCDIISVRLEEHLSVNK